MQATLIFFLGVVDKLKESTLLNVCQSAILSTQHPRTSITVTVQEMQDCGGVSSIPSFYIILYPNSN